MKITRRQLRHMILREVRMLTEAKYNDAILDAVAQILTSYGMLGTGPGSYQIEEFSPGMYDDVNFAGFVNGATTAGEADDLIEILLKDQNMIDLGLTKDHFTVAEFMGNHRIGIIYPDWFDLISHNNI